MMGIMIIIRMMDFDSLFIILIIGMMLMIFIANFSFWS